MRGSSCEFFGYAYVQILIFTLQGTHMPYIT